jgi:hypothetical protein
MFGYYTLLRSKYRIPVLPLVVYLSRGASGISWETYREVLFDKEHLHFGYYVIGLRDLPAKTYLAMQDNPLAMALSALMLPDSLSRVEHKLLCWLGVQNSRLNDAQIHLLGVTIEKYLMLSEIETEEYMEALRLKDMTLSEAKAAFPELNVTTTYERYLLDIGLEQGLEQGRVEEAQRVL